MRALRKLNHKPEEPENTMLSHLQCLPDDICEHVYYKLHNLNMLEVLKELRALFKCPFYEDISWDELFSLGSPNFGGMIFANMKRLTWSIAEEKCSPGLINVTHTMNNSWQIYELLCTCLDIMADPQNVE